MAQSEREIAVENTSYYQDKSAVFTQEAQWRLSQRQNRPDLCDEEFESLQRLTRILERLQS